MNTKILVPVIVVALIVGAASFYGGMKYQEMKGTSARNGQFQRGTGAQAGGRNGQGLNGARPVSGQILSVDANGITVKLSDGSSKIVVVSDSTQINKAATAQKSDLVVGQQVAVFGMANSDGSLTAQNIQLNPMMRGQQASPSPTAK